MQAAFRRALYNVLSQKIYRFKEQELSDLAMLRCFLTKRDVFVNTFPFSETLYQPVETSTFLIEARLFQLFLTCKSQYTNYGVSSSLRNLHSVT